MKTHILFLSLITFFIFQGCGNMSAELTTGKKNNPTNETPGTPELIKPRYEPDAVYGEYIKTTMGTAGYEIRANIGEISEQRASINGNGYTIEGVFYE